MPSLMGERLRPLARVALGPFLRRGSAFSREVQERVQESVREAVGPPDSIPEFRSLGLDAAQIQALCARHGVQALLERIGHRGATAAHLQYIAWHGSALADLGCPRDHQLRDEILKDAALFNLAVALTDSVVDDLPAAAAHTAEALNPGALRRRLRAPDDPAADLRRPDSELSALFALWDDLLVRVGARSRNVAVYADMLDRMHRSEFGAHEDRVPAKTLPIDFIGLLITGAQTDDREPATEARRCGELYRELGALVGLADDWADLPRDLRHMSANQFILARGLRRGDRLVYAMRFLDRLIHPQRFADEVGARLGSHQRRALSAAADISAESRGRTASYLQALHGVPA